MAQTSTIAHSYSHPFCSNVAQMFETIVSEHSKQVLQSFIEKYGEAVLRDSDGLIPFLLASTDLIHHEMSWDIAFGAAHSMLVRGQLASASIIACSLALQLNWHGLPSEWEVQLNYPSRMRFGNWLLPCSDKISVRARSTSVEINTNLGKRCVTHSFDRRVCLSNVSATELPVLYRAMSDWIFLNEQSVETTELSKVDNLVDLQSSWAFSECCRSATDLLDKFAPAYSDWSGRVIRYLVPLQTNSTGMFDSGSRRFLPGLVTLTALHNPVQIAETLVHEASHQYFYVLERFEPLHDPTDTQLYYSAIKDSNRPLIHILLAFHAFGNVCLFFRLVRDRGFVASRELKNYENGLIAKTRALQVELEKAVSLTPSGVELWESLSSELN
jgi:hypothetical protein